jgi:phenylpyruvate tautomerase PptA (4-oxalocrotonate tautomerase family)
MFNSKNDNGKKFIGSIETSLSEVLKKEKPLDKSKELIDGVSSSLSQVLKKEKSLDKSKELIYGVSSSLSQVLNKGQPPDKTDGFINGISSSLSQVLNKGQPPDKTEGFINGISSSLSQVLNKGQPPDKTDGFINGISSSLSQVLNKGKPLDKSQQLVDGISTSLSQVLNKGQPLDKSQQLVDGISSSLSQVLNKGKGLSSVNSKPKTEYTKRAPTNFGKPNVRRMIPMTQEKKLSIEEYIQKVKETIESLNDIIITETLYNKNRDVIRSETDCFDKTAKKQDCKKKSMNENKTVTIVSDFKNKLDELITSGKNESKINEFAKETVLVIKDSPNKDNIIKELTDLESNQVIIKPEDKPKYDIIQTIIKQILDSLLTK